MTTSDPPAIRAALRTALTTAMKQRDRDATAVYRGALGAIDNAEAVPVGSEHRAGPIEGSAVGVGSTDVPRRALTEQDMADVVLGDAQERSDAAALLETADPDRAQRLRHGSDLLRTLVRTLEEQRERTEDDDPSVDGA